MNGWTWDGIVRQWRSRLEEFGIKLETLFVDIHVFDSKNPVGRPAQLSWWPVSAARQLHLGLQEHFDRWPGTRGDVHPNYHYIRRGELETLAYLWKVKDSVETACALLIAASLFSRMHSSRRDYPVKRWPPFYSVAALDELARAQLEKYEGVRFYPWHYSCTDVLPVRNDDQEYTIDSLSGVVRYLAEEHASLFLAVQPTRIVFSESKDPFVAQALEEKYQAERRQRKEWERQYEKASSARAQELQEQRKKHPRWGEFQHLSLEELRTLVWSKPVKQLAAEFGVSDVAIGKRCRVEGIAKPPRGFWAKVESGKIPHPQGVPLKK